MLQHLPESVDFIQQAEREGGFEGGWPIAELARLGEIINRPEGELHATLAFGRCAGFYCLQGRVEASLELICQRCLQPMQYAVSQQFSLGLVSSEDEMDDLPDELDPFLAIKGEQQSVIELLEDELLLALPMAPMHADECSDFLREQHERRQLEKQESSPFAVLKNLKLDQ